MKPGNRLFKSTVLNLAAEMLRDKKLFFRKPLLIWKGFFHYTGNDLQRKAEMKGGNGNYVKSSCCLSIGC